VYIVGPPAILSIMIIGVVIYSQKAMDLAPFPNHLCNTMERDNNVNSTCPILRCDKPYVSIIAAVKIFQEMFAITMVGACIDLPNKITGNILILLNRSTNCPLLTQYNINKAVVTAKTHC